jgi:hypothetical protein
MSNTINPFKPRQISATVLAAALLRGLPAHMADKARITASCRVGCAHHFR